MYLTEQEHEAFMRGRAAGLIPADYPLPSCDKEIDELICHIGIMFSRRIACRNHQRKLRLITLSAFTEEHLRAFTIRLPEVRREEISAVTGLQQELFLNPLEALYHYFTSGREIVSAEDLAGRLAVDVKPIPLQNILNGFEMKYVPAARAGLATSRQKAALAEMICRGTLPTIARRQWENMTREEASRLISSTPKPRAELPVSVALILRAVEHLKPEERELLDKLMIQQNNSERKIA